jgi:periplasmic glucans biosynthesis protein
LRLMIVNSVGLLMLALAGQAQVAPVAAPAKAPAPAKPPAKPVPTYPFTFDTLLEEAKRLAASAYAPQRNSVPSTTDKLSPEQYRSMHFNPDAGIWRAEKLPFRLELLRAAYNLPTSVKVATVEDGVAKEMMATPAMFRISGSLPAQLSNLPLPLSGFRIRSRINSTKVWDEFLVFQGASYFRAVAKNLLYGLSARGLAVNTGEPAGEEFPAFTHFWIERPGPRANSIVIYALLESESATGAYKFTVTPGTETQTDVELTLFPRTEMRSVGIAPLTSMFLFDETNRGRLDDYRPEVHDSGRWQTPSSCRCPRSPVRCHRALASCNDRGSRAIFRISMPSMNGAPAHGSRRKETGAGARSSWSKFLRAARPMTTSWLFGARPSP